MPEMQHDDAAVPLKSSSPAVEPWVIVFAAVLPWLLFTIIVLSFTFLFHDLTGAVWLLCVLCFLVALVVTFAACVRRSSSSQPHTKVILGSTGMLCIFAVLSACLVGIYVYDGILVSYWALAGRRSYENVLPSTAALAHLDAGVISFTEGSRLDTSLALGYMNGDRFCVAPILGSTGTDATVEFWAAGVNCCEQRSGFTCDGAGDAQARGGLVILDASPLETSVRPQFRAAAREAAAAYGLEASTDPIFVQWLSHPEEAIDAMWTSAITTAIGCISCMLIFFLCAAILLTMIARMKRSNPPA